MQKPISIKLIIVITWLKIAQALFVFAVIISCHVAPANEGFWLGLQNAAARSLTSAEDAQSIGAEEFGEATAMVTFMMLFPIGILASIRKRKKGGLYGFLVAGTIVAFGQGAFPLLYIIALIATFRSSAKDYLQPAETPQNEVPLRPEM
ncbi:MAG: hypothetical protein SynsKO_24960 [Synoicihabitans sp.]